jgi:hypothetical protein
VGLISSCGSQATGTDATLRPKREAAVFSLNAVVGKANQVARFGGPWRNANDNVPESALEQMKDYDEGLVRDSSSIDCDMLNSVYRNLGTMFRDKFIKGMALSVEVGNAWLEMRRSRGQLIMTPELQQKADDSKRLETKWAEWFNGHFDDINKALSH